MKNSILFVALLLAFGIGCNKASDLLTTSNQEQTAQNNAEPNVVAVIDRGGDGGCCCNLVVSSTYFEGLTICGLATENSNGSCDRFCTTTCGMSSGISKTFPVGKDPSFCIASGSPFRVTNNGVLPIQIYFICNGTASSPISIPAGGSVIYTNDCNGTTVLCTEAPCS